MRQVAGLGLPGIGPHNEAVATQTGWRCCPQVSRPVQEQRGAGRCHHAGEGVGASERGRKDGFFDTRHWGSWTPVWERCITTEFRWIIDQT